MGRFLDEKTIWIASPIIKDDGEISIIGYTNLREETLCAVPANGYLDIQAYGDRYSRIMKFSSNREIDVSTKGNDGIWFEKPEANEQGFYENPEYISTPLNHFGKVWTFTAERQIL